VNAIALAAAGLLALAAQTADPAQIRKDANEAQRALYEQTLFFPPCKDPSFEAAFEKEIREEAARLKIADLAIAPVAGLEVVKNEGNPSPVRLRRVEVRASAPVFEMQMLLHRIAFERTFRALDFETLEATAADGGSVRFSTRVVEGCWDLDAPIGHAREEREMLQEWRSLSSAIAQLLDRMKPLRLTDGLEAIEEDWGESALLLSGLQFGGGELTLRGVTLGAPARASLEPVLTRAGFEKPRVDWTAAGDCRAFTAVTRVSPAQPPERESLPKDVFDERTVSLCAAQPSAAPIAVKAQGSGPLTLRARNIDVSSAFYLLNELSPADGFVVESDVAGRVDLDLEKVTIGQALEAIRSAAGLGLAGSGSLHRVCRKSCKPASKPDQKYEGAPVSVLVSDADVLDIFRIFGEVSGLTFHARELPGTITIYAREVEWDRLIDTVFAAIGRTYSIGDKNVVRIDSGDVPLEKLAGTPWRRTLRQNDFTKIAAEDLRVVAMAPGRAWVRVPGAAKQMLEIKADTSLVDGRVKAIGEGEVVLSDGRRLKM
jgi:hypothetical protein